MPEGRKLILKLGQKITMRYGHKVTVEDPEYYGLEGSISDEMAEVALKMKVRVPMLPEEVAKKCGKPIAQVNELLEQLADVGLVEYNWENSEQRKQYMLCLFVVGSAENMVLKDEVVEKHPEVFDFFDHMAQWPAQPLITMVPPGGGGIGMHVIPVEKAIPAESKSLDIEHLSHWLKKYGDSFAVFPCACRRTRTAHGEGTGDLADEMCIAVGDFATYYVETGRARSVNYNEVMALLQRAEDNGFVHQITNLDGEDKIFVICNCCVTSCFALRNSQLYNAPNWSRSAYVARVDKDKCTACGQCVEVCPSGAAKLGQKLCTKNGPIVYPKQELPDSTVWGPDKWNPNYRDDNMAINCYDTGTSPCKTACPAHIGVQGYLKKAALGEYREALELIKKENPFPAVCGRICNKRCEEACTRGGVDKALAIDEVKKFIAEQDLNSATRYIPPMVNQLGVPYKEKIAVIGAGPAGMTCAYFLAEKGYPVTVFDKNTVPGGMLTLGIPSFRLEKDVVRSEIDILREMGVEFKCGVDVGKDVTLQQLREQGYKGFYLAIGAQGSRRLNVPGEASTGVISAVDFMRKFNSDDSTRLTGKTVVIGGGNVATDVARAAARAGSKSVTLCCLESRDNMPASQFEVDESLDEGVVIENNRGPLEITSANGKVTGIKLRRCISTMGADGNFAPSFDENDILVEECDNIIVAIGQSIVWGDLLNGEAVELNRNGTVKADSFTGATSVKDIFAGGDVLTGPKWTIDAIAAGKNGALSLHRAVHAGQSITIGRNTRQFIELDKSNILLPLDSFDKPARQEPGKLPIDARTTFRDTRCTFTEEQVKLEASRCLGCGATTVDENKCIGCGLCTTKCKFDAIHLYREHPECSTMNTSAETVKVCAEYTAKRALKIVRKAVTGKH